MSATTGGTSATGGASATGGSSATTGGGTSATGGASATGGTSGTGGTSTMTATGGASTGGSSESGGSAAVAGTTGEAGSPATSGAGIDGFPGNVEIVSDLDHPVAPPPLASEPASFTWWYGIGNWFVYPTPSDQKNADALAADIVPPRGDSTKAYRVQSDGVAGGTDLYAQLDHPEGQARDLSAYAGIGFWAKLDGASHALVVALTPAASYLRTMGDVASVSLTVGSDWQEFELPFEAFGTDGRTVANIDFVVGTDGGKIDLWLNDLVFMCRGECPSHN
jgi:hypothetical protein